MCGWIVARTLQDRELISNGFPDAESCADDFCVAADDFCVAVLCCLGYIIGSPNLEKLFGTRARPHLEVFVTRRMRRYVPLAGLLVMMATTAAAQNITPGTSVHLLVGQPPIRLNLDGDHYYDAPVVAQRSYCAEASGADDELNATHPVLTLYHS